MEFELVVNECRPLKAPILVFHGLHMKGRCRLDVLWLFAGARKSQSKMAAIHWPEAIGAVEQIASMQVDVQTT